MPFISFPEYRPDIDDLNGASTKVLAGVLPRGDGYGPMPNLQEHSRPLAGGNDEYTKVLLHFNGTDASTTITDDNAGGSAHSWSAAGNAQIDTALYKHGGASLLCDGTGDYVSASDHADFNLGASDWTIDVWLKCEAAAGAATYAAGQMDNAGTATTASFYILRNASNVYQCNVFVGGSAFSLTSTTQFTSATNTGWHHLAFVRSGDTLYLFVDGAQEDSDTITGTVNNATNAFSVGRGGEITTNTWNGSIDEFRLSVGIARWTEAFTPPARQYSEASSGTCRGQFYARASDGSIVVFAATDDRLFILDNATLDWQDVTKGGTAYSTLPSTDQWQFAQFGSVVIAVQTNTVPQAYTIGSSVRFADLGGSPPQARSVSVVGRFLVFSRLTSNPTRTHWSDLDGITTWTAGSGFANYFDAPDGGVVLGVAGGEFGLILQESAIRRMVYVPGAKPAFQIERISEDQGLFGPYSIVRAGSRIFFRSQNGFLEFSGGALTPIGKERVDRTILDDIDNTHLELLIGAADPSGTRACWAYKSNRSAVTASFDTLICYDYILGRWSPPLAISGEMLASIAKPGLSLEGLDAISTDLDALPFTLDSVAAAVGSKLSGFDTDHKLGFFDGDNLEAILETPEQGMEGRRVLVRGITPRTDAATVYGSIRHRSNAHGDLSQTDESTNNDEGLCPLLIDDMLARGRVRIPAGEVWTYASGLWADVQPTGRR